MNSQFYDVMEKCALCNKCSLCNNRKNVVWGSGNENSKIMFIGEAPGANEDELGQPFIGRSGKLLDEMLNSVGLERNSDIYITNIVKCRPENNRNPSAIEIYNCIGWLQSQIKIISPKIIVCLGSVASKTLIKKDIKVTKEHGKFFNVNETLYTPFYHPSAILRNVKLKPTSAEDYRKLKDKISELF